MNTLKTAFLLMVMSSLLVSAGYFMGGIAGMVIALALSLGINFMAYWHSDKLALRMAGAKEVTTQDAPVLHSIVEEQAMLSGLPKPRVYLIQNDSPNAFATGRSPQRGGPWRRPRASCESSSATSWPPSWRTRWRTWATATR